VAPALLPVLASSGGTLCTGKSAGATESLGRPAPSYSSRYLVISEVRFVWQGSEGSLSSRERFGRDNALVETELRRIPSSHSDPEPAEGEESAALDPWLFT